jgi:hypothetical protein
MLMDTAEGNAGMHLPVPQDGGARETNPSQMTTADLGAGGNLEKIREILFGSQMRESERKLLRIEERLLKDYAELKEDTRRRLDAIEVFMKKELDALGERLKTEQNARDEAVREGARELQNVIKTFEKKTAQLDEQAAQTQREFRQQLLDQSKALHDELWDKHRELSEAVARAIQELRVEKTDRAVLAAMLTEMAMRLNDELMLPGSA